MEIAALVASAVAVILGFFAVWQAEHHREISDKLNRETMAKLASIEVSTASTEEYAFRIWGEIEKAKGEEMKKLKDEMHASISAEFDKNPKSETGKQFNELERAILKILDKAIVEAEKVDKRSRISSLLASATQTELAILKAVAGFSSDYWTIENIDHSRYTYEEIKGAIALAATHGLIKSIAYPLIDDSKYQIGKAVFVYELDPDFKKALLR